MVARGIDGRIVNMASTNGLVGEEFLAHYNASKFGVVGLTMTMAIELAPENIRVNSVCPGSIHTRLTHSSVDRPGMGEGLSAENPSGGDLATRRGRLGVAYLASTDSGFITGHQLVIDGGQLTF